MNTPLSNINTAFINGQAFVFEAGETIYRYVSRHVGEDDIPVLCNDAALEPFGNC